MWGRDEFGGVLQLMFTLQYTNLEKQRGRRMGKRKREGEWVLGLLQNQGLQNQVSNHLLSKPSLRNLCVRHCSGHFRERQYKRE